MIRCIAVDDEPLALDLIKEYAAQIPDLLLVESLYQPNKVKEALKGDIDLVFMDINMPDISGLDLSKEIHENVKIIFTTAYEQYALESYKVNAIDYLLKPFSFEEFQEAVNKAREFFVLKSAATTNSNSFFYIRSDYKLQKIEVNELLFVENIKDYVRFFMKDGSKYMSLMSLKSVEEKLSVSTFVKVHRSYIVNLNYISEYSKKSIKISDVKIPISEKYKNELSIIISKFKI